jgi:hypothetical protein
MAAHGFAVKPVLKAFVIVGPHLSIGGDRIIDGLADGGSASGADHFAYRRVVVKCCPRKREQRNSDKTAHHTSKPMRTHALAKSNGDARIFFREIKGRGGESSLFFGG